MTLDQEGKCVKEGYSDVVSIDQWVLAGLGLSRERGRLTFLDDAEDVVAEELCC